MWVNNNNNKYFYYALRSILGGKTLFILWTTLYFRGVNSILKMYYAAVFSGVDTVYTKHYVIFPGDEYYLYYALRKIFEGRY